MGQKYVAYDQTGTIIGYFDSAAGAPIVSPTLAVSDDDYAACIASLVPYTVDVVNLVLIAPLDTEVLLASQAAQQAILTQAAQAQISLGFVSSALGEPYSYALDLVTQSNLQAAVIRSGMSNPPDFINFMCADANGVWLRRPHTPSAIIQAALDGMAYVESVLAKKDELFLAVNSATTVEAVQAVVWTYP
jgi:hypothetical protein